MKQIIFIAAITFLFSCSVQENDILGKYEYKGSQTIDSLIIEKNVYIHKIFNKQGVLKYHGKSTWELEKNRVVFSNFYNNEDYNLTDFLKEDNAKKFLIKLSCPIYREGQNVILEVNADQNIYYSKK